MNQVYAEIEGFGDAILSIASRLGIDSSEFIRDSYYYLYILDCRERGVAPGDMIFPDHKRQNEN